MENMLDQEASDPEVVREIVEEITSEEALDILTEEDYTKVLETNVEFWAGI